MNSRKKKQLPEKAKKNKTKQKQKQKTKTATTKQNEPQGSSFSFETLMQTSSQKHSECLWIQYWSTWCKTNIPNIYYQYHNY